MIGLPRLTPRVLLLGLSESRRKEVVVATLELLFPLRFQLAMHPPFVHLRRPFVVTDMLIKTTLAVEDQTLNVMKRFRN